MQTVVVHAPPPEIPSGISNFAEEYARAIEASGKGITIVRANPQFWLRHSKLLKKPTITSAELDAIFPEYDLHDAPGVVHHFHMSLNSFNLVLVKAFKSIVGKTVITLHDYPMDTLYRTTDFNGAHQNTNREILSQAGAVIVSSDYLANKISSFCNVEVIPHAVDSSRYEGSRSKAKKELGLNGTVVSSLGSLHSYKNNEDFLASMAGVDATKLVVGDGPQKDHLMRMAKLFGSNVTFKSALDDVEFDKYILASDIVVFTRKDYEKYETSGVLVRALAAGCCVLSYAVGSFNEYLYQGSERASIGFLVMPIHHEMMSQAVNYILKKPERMGALGKKARKFAIRSLNFRSIVNRHLRVFKGLRSPRGCLQPTNYMTRARKRIAIVSPHPVWPNLSGGKERTYYLASYLKHFGNEVLLTQAQNPMTPPGLNVVNIRGWLGHHADIKAMSQKQGYLEVVRSLRKFGPDVIILDYMYPCALFIKDFRRQFPEALFVLNAHNVEWKYYKSLKYNPAGYNWQRLYNIEKNVLEAVDLVLYTCDEEREDLEKMVPGKKYLSFPNGTAVGVEE